MPDNFVSKSEPAQIASSSIRRKRAGRPKLDDPTQKRDKRVIVLLNDQEFARLERVLAFLDLSQSEYLRGLLVSDLERIEQRLVESKDG